MSNLSFRLTKYTFFLKSDLRCDVNMLSIKNNCKNKNVDYNFFESSVFAP